MFEDYKLHNFIVELKDIEKITFYTSKDTWAEIEVSDNSSFPMNTIAESKVYINIKNTMYSKHINAICEALGEEKIVKKNVNFEATSELCKTNEFRNYRIQTKEQNQTIYTCYLDHQIFAEEYTMFMEYVRISMFNQIRSKPFVSFSQFQQIWETAQSSSKKLSEASDKIKLILVSGIPGSGKTTLGIYLSKLLNIENIQSNTFVMPVKDSTSFTSEAFLKGLFEHVCNKPSPTVVAVIPSYHHLKKAIFEFKKEAQFNDTFDLEHVITRVSAKNFYLHKNRNTYQFLLEN